MIGRQPANRDRVEVEPAMRTDHRRVGDQVAEGHDRPLGRPGRSRGVLQEGRGVGRRPRPIDAGRIGIEITGREHRQRRQLGAVGKPAGELRDRCILRQDGGRIGVPHDRDQAIPGGPARLGQMAWQRGHARPEAGHEGHDEARARLEQHHRALPGQAAPDQPGRVPVNLRVQLAIAQPQLLRAVGADDDQRVLGRMGRGSPGEDVREAAILGIRQRVGRHRRSPCAPEERLDGSGSGLYVAVGRQISPAALLRPRGRHAPGPPCSRAGAGSAASWRGPRAAGPRRTAPTGRDRCGPP